MYGTKVMAQKKQFTPKSETCRKCIESPAGGISASDSLPLEHARELLEPSKDSWSLAVCTERKTFDIWVQGFRWVSLEKGKVLLFFGYFFMTSSPGQWAEIVAENLVAF